MLLGAAGLTIIYALIGAAYGLGILGLPVLILVLAAIAIYALTLAPVTGCCCRKFSLIAYVAWPCHSGRWHYGLLASC